MSVIRFVDSVFLERHLAPVDSHASVGGLEELGPSAIGLNALLIRHPAATFLMQAEGRDMVPWGVQDGDFLLVDRSVTPVEGRLVIAPAWGELRVASLGVDSGRWTLICSQTEVLREEELSVWGVITAVLRRV
jgi:DNA polymerase V